MECPLPEAFSKASAITSGDTLKGKFTDDEMLSLYAYFKIVKVGENKARMPKNMFSPAEVKKHYAWKKLGKMTADEAMQAYVALVQSKMEN